MADPSPAAGFEPRPIRTASAAQQIADQIRESILSGDLAAGHRLPSEVDLAEEYGVSRGTVRETMKILAAAQLVQPARGATGGTFVRHPDPDVLATTLAETLALWSHTGSTSLGEVDDARAWIEEGCVRRAAVVRDEEDLASIRAAVEALEPPPAALDDILAIDLDFHVAVSRAAHNAVLELAMQGGPPRAAVHEHRRSWSSSTTASSRPSTGRSSRASRRATRTGRRRRWGVHLSYLVEHRDRALAERPAIDVPLATLRAEAHPAVEQARARILRGDR